MKIDSYPFLGDSRAKLKPYSTFPLDIDQKSLCRKTRYTLRTTGLMNHFTFHRFSTGRTPGGRQNLPPIIR